MSVYWSEFTDELNKTLTDGTSVMINSSGILNTIHHNDVSFYGYLDGGKYHFDYDIDLTKDSFRTDDNTVAYIYEPSEFLTPSHLQYRIGDMIDAGKTLLITLSTIVVDDPYDDTVDSTVDLQPYIDYGYDIVGWVLVVTDISNIYN